VRAPLDTKKANFSVKMSTAASPKLEDVVATTDVKRGITDQAQSVDVESVVNGETVGAAEDVVDSNDDKDVEKGCVTYVDDPPDGLDRDGKLLEEKIEGSHTSLEVIGDTERTDDKIDQASLKAEVSCSSQVAPKINGHRHLERKDSTETALESNYVRPLSITFFGHPKGADSPSLVLT
jgi:hypothetical protein